MTLHIYHVFHSGANTHYYSKVLSLMNENKYYDVRVTKIRVDKFHQEGVPHDVDVLTYQTYPDEFHTGKFSPIVVDPADKLFRSFQGLKILVCTHDFADADSFSRFADSKTLPRIKCFPSKWFMENYNVILLSTFSTETNDKVYPDKFPRDIKMSCKFGSKHEDLFYGHRIRECVVETLQKFFPDQVDYEWIAGKKKYLDQLHRVLIVIGAPGWGYFNGSYVGALKAGCLLFAYRALNDIHFLPHADLIDGEDYVSYDLFNFKTKLQRLLDNPEEIERIRENGRNKFKRGYNTQITADKFYAYLKKELL